MGCTQFSVTLRVHKEIAPHMIESINEINNKNEILKEIVMHSQVIVKINCEKFNKRFR